MNIFCLTALFAPSAASWLTVSEQEGAALLKQIGDLRFRQMELNQLRHAGERLTGLPRAEHRDSGKPSADAYEADEESEPIADQLERLKRKIPIVKQENLALCDKLSDALRVELSAAEQSEEPDLWGTWADEILELLTAVDTAQSAFRSS